MQNGYFAPDLFLIDFLLEDGNGGELCRALKNDSRYRHTPVILFSAYKSPQTDFHSYGCDTVIEKPFDLDELIATINDLLEKQPC
jgi:CheY-like chemotaxis protein